LTWNQQQRLAGVVSGGFGAHHRTVF
jgi:hypothetical protein